MLKVTVTNNLKALEGLTRRAQELESQRTICLTELVTPAFISDCSRFDSLEDMFEAGGFQIKSPDDLTAIPHDERDEFIRKFTTYQTWQQLLDDAVKQWTLTQLGF
jgi:hypothetical protein